MKKVIGFIVVSILLVVIFLPDLPIITGNYSIKNLIYCLLGTLIWIVFGFYSDKIIGKRNKKF